MRYLPMEVASLFFKKRPDVERLRKEKNVRELIKALRIPDIPLQKEVIQALGTLGPEAVDHLIAAVKTRDTIMKVGVIEALGKIRDLRSVTPLLACLDDESNEVRWVTAIALGEMEDPQVIGPVLRLLSDPDKYVRYGAAFALTRLGWKPGDQTERARYFMGLGEWDVLHEIGLFSIPALRTAMKDRDAGVRLKVLDTLGALEGAEAEQMVLAALSDPDSDVRWRAVLISHKIGISPVHLPRWLAIRQRNKKIPFVAGFLNFMLPGLGYGYLGKWWGIMIFQIDITLTVWLFKFGGEISTYSILFPLYLLLGIHAWYMAKQMPET